jgi:hypothetical protein
MKITPRSVFAPLLALEDPEWMRARLLDLEVNLTSAEREHLACEWGPVGRKRGRPALPAMVKRSRDYAVALSFIWFRHGKPGLNRKSAIAAAAKENKCTEDVVKNGLQSVKKRCGTQVWNLAIKMARKDESRSKLNRFDPMVAADHFKGERAPPHFNAFIAQLIRSRSKRRN